MAVIEIEGLRKEYRRGRSRTAALDGLDLTVPEGGVFGFLGPNGSGKTTTIRCLLGLVRPTAGRARLLGTDGRAGLRDALRTVGSMVETPQFFPNFSGLRNLQLLAGVDRIPRRRVVEVLERVGLAGRATSPFATYSLGMKQRLGLAAALLKDPAVLILDEPANGLDPAGIKATRDLIRNLGAEGRTVFVSSHLLGEVQQMCDRVAILARGRLVTAGPVDEVLAAGRTVAVIARAPDPERAVAVLRAAGMDVELTGGLLRVAIAPAEAGRVTEVLSGSGIFLSELRPEVVDLETVFLELTGVPKPEAGVP